MKKPKSNKANQWIGERAQASLSDLHAATGLPKSLLVWCGLQMFALAGTTTRAEFIAKHSKAKGNK